MCDTCDCNIIPGNAHQFEAGGKHVHNEDGRTAVTVLERLLCENDHQAAHNREHFDRHGVFVLNLMFSPGAGKTSLLEATIDALGDELRIAVIEGDLETENDAELSPVRAAQYLRRLATEVPFISVTTRGEGGIGPWIDWLRLELRARRATGDSLRPAVWSECARSHGAGVDPSHTPNHNHETHSHFGG